MTGRLWPRAEASLAFAPVLALITGASRPPRARRLGEQRTESTRISRFEADVLVHLDAAYTLARYLTRDEAAAEDVVQDAVVKALKHFDGFRGGDAKAWLLTIVRRRFIDWCAERRRDRGLFVEPSLGEVEETPDPEGISAETGLIRSIDAAFVRGAVEALPEPYREAVVLRDLEEMSYREIAEITAVPIGTVMSRLARGRALLAASLGGGAA